MTKRSGISVTNADYRFSKPLADIDLSGVTGEVIVDLSPFGGKFSGWRIIGNDIGWATQSATSFQIGLFFASSQLAILSATQDAAVFGRSNTSSAATGLGNGSGTGIINVAGIGNFVSTATGAAGANFELLIGGINSIPSWIFDSVYTTTGNTVGVANGGGRFFSAQPCTFIRLEGSAGGATGTGQRFHKGRFQIFGMP